MGTRRRVVVAVVIAVAAFGGLVAYLVSPPSDAPFREYVEQLRAAGEPVTLAAYLGPVPNPLDDAAEIVLAAPQHLATIRATGATGPWDPDAVRPWFETASSERLSELSERLADLDEYFVTLNEASQRGRLVGEHTRIDSMVLGDELVRGLQAAGNLVGARAFAGSTEEQRLEAMETELLLSRLAAGTLIRRAI